jgi:hypothetical protein
VVYVELKHWKSASRKMSVLGWSFAPIETLVDASSPPDDPGPRAGSPSISKILALWSLCAQESIAITFPLDHSAESNKG